MVTHPGDSFLSTPPQHYHWCVHDHRPHLSMLQTVSTLASSPGNSISKRSSTSPRLNHFLNFWGNPKRVLSKSSFTLWDPALPVKGNFSWDARSEMKIFIIITTNHQYYFQYYLTEWKTLIFVLQKKDYDDIKLTQWRWWTKPEVSQDTLLGFEHSHLKTRLVPNDDIVAFQKNSCEFIGFYFTF